MEGQSGNPVTLEIISYFDSPRTARCWSSSTSEADRRHLFEPPISQPIYAGDYTGGSSDMAEQQLGINYRCASIRALDRDSGGHLANSRSVRTTSGTRGSDKL